MKRNLCALVANCLSVQTVNGVVLKHQPPPDAFKPDKKWRMYVWKDAKLQDEPYYLHRSVYPSTIQYTTVRI